MLKGIRVIDFSRYLPGPYASQRLADLGAEVIKVESTQGGDPARGIGDKVNGTGLGFLAVNRNKKSVTVNFREEDGREIAFRLAAQADVVIESFRPGIADGMGIGYERLQEVNPRLIYCSLTGFGQTGPLRDMAGHDLNFAGRSGLLSQLKDQGGRPILPTIQLGDLIGGLAASEAILAALIRRGITGEGGFLDISLTDVLAEFLGGHVLVQNETGRGNGLEELTGKILSYHIYEIGDGRFVALAALEEKFWVNFCREAGCAELISARFSEASKDNLAFKSLQEIFQSRSFAEWAVFAERVDCCLTPVMEVVELLKDQRVKEKGLFFSNESASWGKLLLIRTMAGGLRKGDRISGGTASENGAVAPPLLGADNEAVYGELLQASTDQVADCQTNVTR